MHDHQLDQDLEWLHQMGVGSKLGVRETLLRIVATVKHMQIDLMTDEEFLLALAKNLEETIPVPGQASLKRIRSIARAGGKICEITK